MSIIRLCCLWGLLWVTAGAGAQVCNAWWRVMSDSVLRSEWDALCRRNLSFKVEEAKRWGLDSLPEVKRSVEAYRSQLARQAWKPQRHSRDVSRKVQRIRVSQLFFSLPQNLPQRGIREAEQRMDSFYTAICQGSSFDACVQRSSEQKGARWVARLQVPAEFEEAVWHLPVGGVSKPFFTPLGIHLVKVLQRDSVPVAAGLNDERRQVEERVAHFKQRYGYKEHRHGRREWLATGRTAHVLFTFGGMEYRAADIQRFARTYPARREAQWQAFVRKTVLDKAYSDWLAQDSVAGALNRYRDAVLARAACGWRMRQCNGVDEAGLKQYFQAHMSDYQWDEPRFYGVVIHAVSKRVGKQVRRFFKQLPAEEWGDAIRLTFPEKMQAEVRIEAGPFAPGANAYVDDKVYKLGKAKPLDGYPCILLLGKKSKTPQDYREVRAAVWRDWLHQWEEQWMKERKWKKED